MSKCAACQYYDRNDAHSEDKGVRWGKCRRTGPMVHPVSAKAYIVEGVWPHVRDDDWCGEWVASTHRVDSTAAAAMNSLLMQTAASAARPPTLAASSSGPHALGSPGRTPLMPVSAVLATPPSASSATPSLPSPFGSATASGETADLPGPIAQGLRAD